MFNNENEKIFSQYKIHEILSCKLKEIEGYKARYIELNGRHDVKTVQIFDEKIWLINELIREFK